MAKTTSHSRIALRQWVSDARRDGASLREAVETYLETADWAHAPVTPDAPPAHDTGDILGATPPSRFAEIFWLLEQWRLAIETPPVRQGAGGPPRLALDDLKRVQDMDGRRALRANENKLIAKFPPGHPERWVLPATATLLARVFPRRRFRPTNLVWYPAGGWMGWHTNADQPGWRLYINWSMPLGGRSAFLGLVEGKIVRRNDPGGWSANCFKISADRPFWHAVDAATPRLSVGFQALEVF